MLPRGARVGEEGVTTGTEVIVLTPRSTVAVLQAGFVPELHPTALG